MATATIHLKNIRANALRLAELAPNSKLLAIVKANAYGHGAIQVAKTLNDMVAGFGVARLQEALALRQALPRATIAIMSEAATTALFTTASKDQFGLFIHSEDAITQLLNTPLAKPIDVWLKIDTGMHRLGIPPKASENAIKTLLAATQVRNLRVLTHLAGADEANPTDYQSQLVRFSSIEKQPLETSIANSAALLRDSATHADWVRPGISLYGVNPLKGLLAANSDIQLKASMSLTAPVIAIRQLKANQSVGYGATWQAKHDTCIATLAVGYGDGYPRHAANGTPVAINGQVYSLAGRVSMDMITVEIGLNHSIKVGDTAELWGSTIDISDVANSANTIPYELFCRLTPRVNFEWLQ